MDKSATYSDNQGYHNTSTTANPVIPSELTNSLGKYFADYQKKGYDEAKNDYEKQLKEKDKQIDQLKMLLAQYANGFTPPPPTIIPIHNYAYNSSLFPNPNGNVVIDTLIELTLSKREKGKYIINTKTDWYMVWKVLHYFKIYIGSEYDFIDIVNECILPNITDDKRKEDLTVNNGNFSSIHSTNPMKAIPVLKWRKTLEKQRATADKRTKLHGTFALDRGVNIMTKLQDMLQIRNIRLENSEKII